MELFGAPHFGANRGIVGLSPAVGGYLLSTKVAGRVYAAAADHGANECVAGGACYRNAWGVNLACVVVAALACAALARATGGERKTRQVLIEICRHSRRRGGSPLLRVSRRKRPLATDAHRKIDSPFFFKDSV